MRGFILAISVVMIGAAVYKELPVDVVLNRTAQSDDEKIIEADTNTQVPQPMVNAPIGSIIAWVPFLSRTNPVYHDNALAGTGWEICDGRIIADIDSPWFGQRTPDFTDRFLRGGPLSDALIFQEDQIQDHTHVDAGHTHTESGHSHTDNGHTHTDSGHIHSYLDSGLKGPGTEGGANGHLDYIGTDRNTESGHANIQSGKANLATTRVELTTNPSGTAGVSEGENGEVRYGEETRPKAGYITWIIKVRAG